MRALRTAIVNSSPTLQRAFRKSYRWDRTPDGRYNLYGVELFQPHTYGHDVYTRKDVDTIFANTSRHFPFGKLIVGHNTPPAREEIQVGDVTNYRQGITGTIFADFLNIEPGVMLDIALGRLRHRSVELECPNLDTIEAVALLGSRRQFFNYPELKVRMSDDEMATIRKDAEAFPAMRNRTRIDRNTYRSRRYRGLMKEKEPMQKKFRQTMKDGSLVHEVSEDDGKTWRALREGESMDSQNVEQQLQELTALVEELFERISALEEGAGTKKREGEEDKEEDDQRSDDSEKKDDEKEKSEMQRSRKVDPRLAEVEKSHRALQSRIDRSEMNSRLDALVAQGYVIDASTRSTLIKTLLSTEEKDRDSTLDSFLKSMRKVSLGGGTEGEEGSTRTRDPKAFYGDDENEVAETERFMGRLKDDGQRKKAEAALIEYQDLIEKEPGFRQSCRNRLAYVKVALDS